jgi:hypothetical protein
MLPITLHHPHFHQTVFESPSSASIHQHINNVHHLRAHQHPPIHKTTMTAHSVADSEDYEHWPDGELLKVPPKAAAGYDSHNGLRSAVYVPTKDDDDKTASPATPKAVPAKPSQPQVIYTYQPFPQMMTYPHPMQYAYASPQPMPMGMPMGGGYYAYGAPAMPMPVMCAAAPAPAPAPYEAPKPTKFKGRTKKQVEEDNMKIAQKEGAWDKRKMQPVGVKDDQLMWVIELDGSQCLRYVLSNFSFCRTDDANDLIQYLRLDQGAQGQVGEGPSIRGCLLLRARGGEEGWEGVTARCLCALPHWRLKTGGGCKIRRRWGLERTERSF